MTNWLPEPATEGGPRYMAIADAMARDIDSGRLKPGDKLPPQRDLAFDLGVTIGTIGRAYGLAQQRGLVAGEVGRGTYVLDRAKRIAVAAPAPQPSPLAASTDPSLLRMDSTAAANVGQAGLIAAVTAEVCRDEPRRVNDYVRELPPHWREAGSRWLATGGWRPLPETVVPVTGVQSGVMAAMAAATAPGDRIVFEELTFPAMARGALFAGRRAVRVAIGPSGLDPDEFESLCAQQHPRALVTIPTIHNPTLAVVPSENRQRIAEIARRHNVWIIEDNIYGGALDEAPPPFAALAPERTFHLGGLSKTVSAGLRTAWLAAPPGLAGSVFNAHRLMTGGLVFLLAETASRLVLSGTAAMLRQKVKAETTAREAIARDMLEGLSFRSHPDCPFLWLELPEPWLPGTFKRAARECGILIDDADEFKVGQVEIACHRVRVGFSLPPDREAVARGFRQLRRLLDTAAVACDCYE